MTYQPINDMQDDDTAAMFAVWLGRLPNEWDGYQCADTITALAEKISNDLDTLREYL